MNKKMVILRCFSNKEIDVLAKAADSLSVILGKPIIAEIDIAEDGFEWVAFGIPIPTREQYLDSDSIVIMMGGPNSRIINKRSYIQGQQAIIECSFLLGIQITSISHQGRFAKVDKNGERISWGNTIEEVLPINIDKYVDNYFMLNRNPLFLHNSPFSIQ